MGVEHGSGVARERHVPAAAVGWIAGALDGPFLLQLLNLARGGAVRGAGGDGQGRRFAMRRPDRAPLR